MILYLCSLPFAYILTRYCMQHLDFPKSILAIFACFVPIINSVWAVLLVIGITLFKLEKCDTSEELVSKIFMIKIKTKKK